MVPPRDDDAAVEALTALVEQLDRTRAELGQAVERAHQLVELRNSGRSWLEIVQTEERPLIIERISQALDDLGAAAGASGAVERAATTASTDSSSIRPGEVMQEAKRGLVGPMGVVDGQQQRLGDGEVGGQPVQAMEQGEDVAGGARGAGAAVVVARAASRPAPLRPRALPVARRSASDPSGAWKSWRTTPKAKSRSSSEPAGGEHW